MFQHHDPVEAVHRAIEEHRLCNTPQNPQACPAYQAAMRAVVAYRSWQSAPAPYPFAPMGWTGSASPAVFHVHVGDGLTLMAHSSTADSLQHMPYRDIAKADVTLPLDLTRLDIVGKDTVAPGQLILLPPQDTSKEHPAP